MTINCNVTGSERKRLAQTLGAILLTEPIYTKAPTFAYTLGDYTIDKIGTIFCPESAGPETVAEIIAKLTDEGFTPKISEEAPADNEPLPVDEEEVSPEEAPAEIPAETPDVEPEAEIEATPEEEATEATVGAEMPDVAASEEDASADADQPVEEVFTEENRPVEESTDDDNSVVDADLDENRDEDSPADADKNAETDDTKLTISIPRDKLSDDALSRLRTIVANKEDLFKRALLTDALQIEATEDEVSFPWFTLTGNEGEPMAYTQFITALCQMATEQTRVLDKPYDGDNDRFAMRIFMVRLGMKGAEFALARKLLMKHLTGNSGWRYGDPDTKPERRGASNRSAVQHVKKAYLSGTRLALIPMDDASGVDIQIGTHGSVIGVDDNGSMFIKLDNGSAFGIAFNTESVKETEAPVSEEGADTPAEDSPADTGETIAEEDASDSNNITPNPNEVALPDEGESDANEDVPVSDEYFHPDEDEPDAESDGEEDSE